MPVPGKGNRRVRRRAPRRLTRRQLPLRCRAAHVAVEGRGRSRWNTRGRTGTPPRGALLVRFSRDGNVVFPADTDPVTGKPFRVPLWSSESLAARVFRGRNHEQLLATRDVPHLPEEGPHDCRSRQRRRTPYSGSDLAQSRGAMRGNSQLRADPNLFRERLPGCMSCKMFPTSAILSVGSMPGGKGVTLESPAPAGKTCLALDLFFIHKTMNLMAIT